MSVNAPEQGPIELPEDGADLGGFLYADPASVQKEQNPPKRERVRDRIRPARKVAEPKKREPPSKAGEFIEPLTEIYVMLGFGVGMADHDGICGPVIADNAHAMAISWDELAQKNESVRRTLRKLTQGGAWAGVIAAHAPVALAIMGAHNMIPGLPGNHQDEESEADAPPQAASPEPIKAGRQPRKRTVSKPKPEDRAKANERRSDATNEV